jgi:ribonucleoside-triphosphate reductase
MVTFMREWAALAASGTGERGIFNLEAANRASPRRKKSKHLRTNPCGEINLDVLTGEFCNLTEVVVRDDDTFDDLTDKVKSAVWMGVMQACLTDFPFLRPSWKQKCDEERLLGVSLTGQMDNPRLMSAEKLEMLRGYAIKVCRKACKALGINMSVAITTGKPSGTVSQLVNCASGAHPRFARHYIRRVRIDAKDPLFHMMRAQGVKFTPENGQRPEDVKKKRTALIAEGHTEEAAKILVPDWSEDQVMMWVVSFPEAAPKGCITRHDVTAIEQLEWYLKVKQNWCEHNQSLTVYVRDGEWLRVGSWVYDHWDDISGVSFLPYDGGHYEQAPYEEINDHQYAKLVKEFPKIDYTQLSQFEQEDNTTGSKSYACSGDKCEIV